MMKKIIFMSLFLLLLFSTAFTQYDSRNVKLISRLPQGQCDAVFTDSIYAYVGNGTVLDILDISDPSNPVKLGEFVTESRVNDIYYSNGYVFIANWSDGLKVIDVSNPIAPVAAASLNFEGQCWKVSVFGNYAYVGNDTLGLRIVDITIPTSPILVSTFNPPNCLGAEYAFVVDTVMYLAAKEGLYTVDISNPALPVQMGYSPSSLGSYNISVSNDIAYLPEFTNGIRMVDVSNLHSPTEIGFYDTPGNATWIEILGDHAYIAVYDSGLCIIDVSNPKIPQPVTVFDTERAYAFYIQKNLLYLADRSAGLKIIDINDPALPSQVGVYKTKGMQNDVYISNNYAYVAEGFNGIRIIDISDPNSPKEINNIDTKAANKVQGSGEYIYVMDEYDLLIFNISDPNSPEQIAIIEDGVVSVFVNANYAYVGGNPDLRIFDVSDPGSPVLVSTMNGLYGYPRDIFVDGSYAYLAQGAAGLRILNIFNPAEPYEISYFEGMNNAYAVYVARNHAYVVDKDGSLIIIDATFPYFASFATSIEIGPEARDVHGSGDFVYVLNSWDGMSVFDIVNPENPIETGFFNTCGFGRGIYSDSTHIYIADGGGGLYILQNEAYPEISVSIDSIQANLYTGQTSPKKVTISNTGTSSVAYGVAIDRADGGSDHNYAIYFDGLEDYISVQIPGSHEQFTISMWFYIDSDANQTNTLFASNPYESGGCTTIMFVQNNRLIFEVDSETNEFIVPNSTVIETDTWYHVAASYDNISNIAKVYIDGKLSGELQGTVGPVQMESALIGGLTAWNGWDLKGVIDEVRIWNRIRTSYEINADILKDIAGDQPGLLAYWRFNNPYERQASDQTPNAYHGMLNGNVYCTYSSRPFLSWISYTYYTGVVAPESSDDVYIVFNALRLVGGEYDASITIASNDVNQPEIKLPAHLTVTDAPDIYIEDNRIVLEETVIGTKDSIKLIIVNHGSLPLEIIKLEIDQPVFELSAASLTIEPWGENTVTITFEPLDEGAFNTELIITSNDPDENITEIPINATAKQAPIVLFDRVQANLKPMEDGSVNWGDYDVDGDLDILVTGRDETNHYSIIYRNDGNDTFTDIEANLIPMRFGSGEWGDYDNDGDLDILLTGRDDTNYYTEIYRNDGNDKFLRIKRNIFNIGVGSAAWGDYDNDGDLDILLTGFNGEGNYSFIYRNDGNNSFQDIEADIIGVGSGAVAWGDYDNDCDLDILLTGRDESSVYAIIYRNENNGKFTDIQANLKPVWDDNTAVWVDYDNDGDLDIMLTGLSDFEDTRHTIIYCNYGKGNFVPILVNLPPSFDGISAWGDYDNDGDMDLLFNGENSTEDWTRLYQNDGNDAFTRTYDNLQDLGECAAEWGDYDNDGDLDILTIGKKDGVRHTIIYRNESTVANTPPTPPANLTSYFQNGNLILKWIPGSDKETPVSGLSYNIRIGTTPQGGEIMSSHSDNITGKRCIIALGNAQKDTTWTIHNLDSNTTYYWSVQTIDAAYAASEWANPVIASMENQIYNIPSQFRLNQNYPNPFNPTTTISYQLPNATKVNLSIYNINGQLIETVINENKNAGYYSLIWDGTHLSSGLYFYKIIAGDFIETKKLIIMK